MSTNTLLERIGDVLAWQPGDPIHDVAESEMRGNTHRRLFDVIDDHWHECQCDGPVPGWLYNDAQSWIARYAAGVEPCSPRIVGVPELEPEVVPKGEADYFDGDPFARVIGWTHPPISLFTARQMISTSARAVAAAQAWEVSMRQFSETVSGVGTHLADLTRMLAVTPQTDDPQPRDPVESPLARAFRLRSQRGTGPPPPRLDGRRAR